MPCLHLGKKIPPPTHSFSSIESPVDQTTSFRDLGFIKNSRTEILIQQINKAMSPSWEEKHTSNIQVLQHRKSSWSDDLFREVHHRLQNWDSHSANKQGQQERSWASSGDHSPIWHQETWKISTNHSSRQIRFRLRFRHLVLYQGCLI